MLTLVIALGSALFFNNKLITKTCPCCAAWCKGVYPAVVLGLTSAPCSIRSRTIATWPWWQATWRGVYPARVRALESAPARRRSCATGTRSSWAQRWRGVKPFWNWRWPAIHLLLKICVILNIQGLKWASLLVCQRFVCQYESIWNLLQFI